MKSILMLVACALLTGGCESVLSDVEINDPTVLTANGYLSRSQTEGVLSSQTITLHIRDKNGAMVELLNGSATVNGLLMDYDNSLTGYRLHEEQVIIGADSLYLYDVVLADETHYSAGITTQEQLLEYTHFPAIITTGDNLTFGWSGAGQLDPFEITLTVYAGNNSRTFTFQLGDLSQQEYTISAVYLLDPPNADRANVTLKSTRTVPGHPDFRESSLTSTFSCAREFTINAAP